MRAYYNEIDPFLCQWLQELINRGLIPDGEIDNRSISDISPDDLKGFEQCHFFAGIGGWPYALGLAGWPDDLPIWTGSCPCQPFSVAGEQKGFDDERHLWPAFYRLITEAKERPLIIVGEQVAGKLGLAWLDAVFSDLEKADYSCGAANLCAAGIGAPHIRQRLYWMAYSLEQPLSGKPGELSEEAGDEKGDFQFGRDGSVGGVDNASGEGLERFNTLKGTTGASPEAGNACGLEDSGAFGRHGRRPYPMPTNGFWANPDWLSCGDKTWRPVKSGLVPLVDGVSQRVGRRRDCRAIRQRIRGYGNAIVPPLAAEFIKAVKDIVTWKR